MELLQETLEELEEKFENATKEERRVAVKEIAPNLKVGASKRGVECSKHGKNQVYTVSLSTGSDKYNFTFHDSIANYNKGIRADKLDMLWAILMDASAYSSYPDFHEFAEGFGYGLEPCDLPRARKAYRGCLRAYEILHDLLGDVVYEKLQCVFRGY